MKSHYNKRKGHRSAHINIHPPQRLQHAQSPATSHLSTSLPPTAAPSTSPPLSSSPLPSSSPVPSSSPIPSSSPSPLTDLFIRNLHPSTTPASLTALFLPFGPIHSLRIIHTKSHPHYSREIAYLSFSSPSSASAALSLNGSFLDGRFLIISPSRRFSDQRDWLFPHLPDHIRLNLALDGVAEYSVTDEETADSLSRLLLHFIPSTSTVTDACACVGGNTLSFARHFDHVQACELDRERFNMLCHNLALACPDRSVSTLLGDYLQLLDVTRQDAVFVDPPFGGHDFELYECVQPSLSSTSMGQLASLLFRQSRPTRVVLLKLPRNIDWRGLLLDCEHGRGGGVQVAKVHYPKLVVMVMEVGRGREAFVERVRTAPVGGVREGVMRFVLREDGWEGLEEKGEGEGVDGRRVWEDVNDWTGVEEEVRQQMDKVDPHVPFTPVAFAQVKKDKKKSKGKRGKEQPSRAVVHNPFAGLEVDEPSEEALSDDEPTTDG